MREGHHLSRRIAETLDLGATDDLFGPDEAAEAVAKADEQRRAVPEPSFGDALRSLLGATIVGG